MISLKEKTYEEVFMISGDKVYLCPMISQQSDIMEYLEP